MRSGNGVDTFGWFKMNDPICSNCVRCHELGFAVTETIFRLRHSFLGAKCAVQSSVTNTKPAKFLWFNGLGLNFYRYKRHKYQL